MKTNDTNANLDVLWRELSKAYSSLDSLFFKLASMNNIPDNIKEKISKIDKGAIWDAKDEIEEEIQENRRIREFLGKEF
ncbi:hypothetical protein [Priestia megaterium]|uniref:hypothetical protein n=1 Tax=Priestia megaterium TaxID=1404 RepID=UPI000BFC248F|nr:hypothetical protein [Priestia megaterium]PGO60655.1 hypothetical protein CN981_08890 [Priestia megaterium]